MFPSNVESNFDVIFPFDIANISHFFIYKETPWFQSLLLQSPTDVAYIALSNINSEKCLSSKKIMLRYTTEDIITQKQHPLLSKCRRATAMKGNRTFIHEHAEEIAKTDTLVTQTQEELL